MAVTASSSRITLLAAAADAVAVVVFAAVGRLSHGEPDDLLGLVGTAAPFAVGLMAGWATPVVRRDPAAWRAGLVAVVCTWHRPAAASGLHRAAPVELRGGRDAEPRRAAAGLARPRRARLPYRTPHRALTPGPVGRRT